MNVGQLTLSHHMKIPVDRGVVSVNKVNGYIIQSAKAEAGK